MSAMSTMKTMALTPRQYRSHIGRKRGWPPRSQHLIDTLPRSTRFMLKPIVAMVLHTQDPRQPDYSGYKTARLDGWPAAAVGSRGEGRGEGRGPRGDGGGGRGRGAVPLTRPCIRRPGSNRVSGGQRRRTGAGAFLLTDRALSSDVLPAFCRPSMVTSISVALEVCIVSGLAGEEGRRRGAQKRSGRRFEATGRRDGGRAYQKVLIRNLYSFLNSPAMVPRALGGRLRRGLADERQAETE